MGVGGSKKHSRAFPAPGNTVNVNSMSYGEARKMEEHAGRHYLQERSSVERPSCHVIFVHLITTIPLSWLSGTKATSFRSTGKFLTPTFYSPQLCDDNVTCIMPIEDGTLHGILGKKYRIFERTYVSDQSKVGTKSVRKNVAGVRKLAQYGISVACLFAFQIITGGRAIAQPPAEWQLRFSQKSRLWLFDVPFSRAFTISPVYTTTKYVIAVREIKRDGHLT
ncbi:hypothetical protein G5I_11187 [Acromyrmex echinatior]|uniref:Uncharacterized protein n=1 Tax=Acromyrmex echinatior TaxID=103372 RepID=F4WYX3_ACREC|nr:hypothetical protein G5I_11187 [Acromyrmex echinatior]